MYNTPCISHKYKNDLKAHDQCINYYIYLFFFISPITSQLCLGGFGAPRTEFGGTKIQTKQRCDQGVVSQGLTHLREFSLFFPHFILLTAILFLYPRLSFFFFFLFCWRDKTKKKKKKASTGVPQGLTHLG